jgi:chorismate-pyruvate lyase
LTGPHAPVVHAKTAEAYLARIEAHLALLSQGHDPLGHLFGIERLARAARAEWWEAERHAERASCGQVSP